MHVKIGDTDGNSSFKNSGSHIGPANGPDRRVDCWTGLTGPDRTALDRRVDRTGEWTGPDWTGPVWTGPETGLDRTGEWTGPDRTDLDGLDWIDLTGEWTGPDWTRVRSGPVSGPDHCQVRSGAHYSKIFFRQ